jgi:hypothetical protein
VSSEDCSQRLQSVARAVLAIIDNHESPWFARKRGREPRRRYSLTTFPLRSIGVCTPPLKSLNVKCSSFHWIYLKVPFSLEDSFSFVIVNYGCDHNIKDSIPVKFPRLQSSKIVAFAD